jgi:hypothetical protein
MSMIDIAYLATVLFSFTGFAGVLAYYSQTCAAPNRKQAEPNRKPKEPASNRPRVAAAH